MSAISTIRARVASSISPSMLRLRVMTSTLPLRVSQSSQSLAWTFSCDSRTPAWVRRMPLRSAYIFSVITVQAPSPESR